MNERPMTEAEEKLLHADLRELLGSSQPPDLISPTLARLGQLQTPAAPSRLQPVGEAGRRMAPPRRVRVRYALEALVLLAALGLTTWVILAPKNQPENQPSDKQPEGLPAALAAGPGAEFERTAETVRVRSGWFLLGTGAPSVEGPGAAVTHVSGQLLLRVGTTPREEEFTTDIEAWLAQHSWELTMIKTFKRWVQVGGTALLLLAGSAMVNGERLEAEDVPIALETATVHTVRSIRDIESLPKDATEVIGVDLTDGHLESLGKISSLRRVSLRGCQRITDAGIGLLSQNRALTALDISLCPRLTRDCLIPLTAMDKLTELRANMSLLLMIGAMANEGQQYYRSRPQLSVVFDAFDTKATAATTWNDASIERLVALLPNITQLLMEGHMPISIGDLGLKAMSKLASLEILNLELSTEMSDAGIAYLKACKRLKALSITTYGPRLPGVNTPKLGSAILEQIGGIASLEKLSIDGANLADGAFGSSAKLSQLHTLTLKGHPAKENILEEIGRLTSLEELRIAIGFGTTTNQFSFSALSKLNKLKVLDITHINFGSINGPFKQSLPLLPALEEVHCYAIYFDGLADSLAAQPRLRVLRIVPHANMIGGTILGLAKLKHLEILELQQTWGTGNRIRPDWSPLKELKKLKEIIYPREAHEEDLVDLQAVVDEMPDCKLVSR